nr:hypothetical protein [Tanacetum cinerariifolium]
HASVAQGGFYLFSLKEFPIVLVINLLYFLLDVVKDALAQGTEGIELMQNEDHQVLGNEQKLEEDASGYTRVDDYSVEFSYKERHRVCEAYSCERLLLKAKLEFSRQLTMHVVGPASELDTPKENRLRFYKHSTQSNGELTEFKSRLMQQGIGLDELKHDLSTKESVAHKSASESSHFVPLANIEPNKADSEEVVDLDLNQLPTLAFKAIVSSIILISSLLHKTFVHTISKGDGADDSGPGLPFETYQLLWSSSSNSRVVVSFDMSASLKHLSGSARARLATSILRLTERIGMSGLTDGANVEAYSCGSLGLGKQASNRQLLWRLLQLLLPLDEICPFVTTCYCTSLTNTDAPDSRAESSFDRPAISGVPFWHWVLISQVSSKGNYGVISEVMLKDTHFGAYTKKSQDTVLTPICRIHQGRYDGKTDDANLTMEEYIELEAEKARRRAIVFDDPLGTDHKILSEPTLGGARRRMSWRQFILAIGLHTTEGLYSNGFKVYLVPSYSLIRDPLMRPCNRLTTFNIAGKSQARGYLGLGSTWTREAAGCCGEVVQADQEIPKKGVQVDPTPVHAPQAPITTPTTRTMP